MIKRSLTLTTVAFVFWIFASVQLALAQTTSADEGIQGLPTPVPLSESDFAACNSTFPADATRRANCAIILDYTTAYSNHYKNMMAIREHQFQNQMNAGGPIFTLVVGIVVIGLVLSVFQFLKGWLFATRVPAAADAFGSGKLSGKSDSTADPFSDEGDSSFKGFGFEVRSSVIGLIVLGVSLAFFFLYLKYVYIINPIPQQ